MEIFYLFIYCNEFAEVSIEVPLDGLPVAIDMSFPMILQARPDVVGTSAWFDSFYK
jgi:hypothetical protein